MQDPGLIPGSERSVGEVIGYPLQYSWSSIVAQLIKNSLQCRKPGFSPWAMKIPWRREWQSIPVFLPGEFHGQRSHGKLQSMGSHRVGHDWVTNTFTFINLEETISLNFLTTTESNRICEKKWMPIKFPLFILFFLLISFILLYFIFLAVSCSSRDHSSPIKDSSITLSSENAGF